MLVPGGTRTLVSEANHRIANSMAAIAGVVRLQASDERRVAQLRSPAEVRSFLGDITARIDAAAQLHRFLAMSDHGSELEISDFIHSVARSTVSAHAISTTALSFDRRAWCTMRAEDALSIGLIVVELVTNALKYAHPAGVAGNIWVICDRTGDDLNVEVVDDGVGLPEDLDWTMETSLGYRLIRSLTRQLDGDFDLHNSDTGVRAVLRVPCRLPAEPEPA
jgi:two-component sensor histidine kinase